MIVLAADFEPIAAIAAGGGPMNVTPASAQAVANCAFSDRKPYPGWMACAPVLRAMARIASALR